jgi:hypothetical protein
MIKRFIKIFLAEKIASSRSILGNLSSGRVDKPGVWYKA